MSVLKCKMCGASLNYDGSTTVVECEYCFSKQTVPKLDDEKKLALYDRANNYRSKKEFDRACFTYESIISESPNEAEAHWGICLCRYGIEYVVDPASGKRIPTCHRTQYKSILEDEDYLSAIKNADILAKEVYQAEAQYIDSVQKGILEISSKEEPFDIFICYKETDEQGERTVDSVIAQDIYNELVASGYKVFFARITLEDKLGAAYEPYIFAALNSARIMLVVGTKPENYEAVWVKNEWLRYLYLIEKGEKKTLIPCYRNITVYELPDEFVSLQAQDVSKVGWKQDLIRGITKILPLHSKSNTDVLTNSSDVTIPLLERAKMYIEDGNWDEAINYYNRVLDINPFVAFAYAGLLMADRHVKNIPDLEFCKEPLDKSNYYEKVLRFGDEGIKSILQKYNQIINERIKENHSREIYDRATSLMNAAMIESEFNNAADLFKQIVGYKDSKELATRCIEEWNDRVFKAKKALDNLANALSTNSSVMNFKSQLDDTKKEEMNLHSQLLEVESFGNERDDLIKSEIEMKNRLERLRAKKASLGVLAIRQKKAIEQEIDSAQDFLQKTSKRIAEVTATLAKKSTGEQIKKKLESILEQKIEIEKQIEKENAKQRERESLLNEAKVTFLTNKYFHIVAKETKTIQLLAEDNKLLKELLVTSAITSHRDNMSHLLRNKQIQTAVLKDYPLMRILIENESLFNLLPIKSKLKIQIKNSSRVFLGAYPQKDAYSKQPIEWITLYQDEKMALLLSKFCLDAQKFNSSKENYVVHWENSEIRKWLNNQFFCSVFNLEEQSIIYNAQLNNPAGPSEYSRAGNVTSDSVFLLSCAEADTYLKDLALKGGFPTAYARSKGLEISSRTQETGWWLRTSGDGVCSAYVAYSGSTTNNTYSDPTTAMYMRVAGNSSNYGVLAYEIKGVRPAILVDLTD